MKIKVSKFYFRRKLRCFREKKLQKHSGFHIFPYNNTMLFFSPEKEISLEKLIPPKNNTVTPTWFEHATFWSGVRRATVAPRGLSEAAPWRFSWTDASSSLMGGVLFLGLTPDCRRGSSSGQWAGPAFTAGLKPSYWYIVVRGTWFKAQFFSFGARCLRLLNRETISRVWDLFLEFPGLIKCRCTTGALDKF